MINQLLTALGIAMNNNDKVVLTCLCIRTLVKHGLCKSFHILSVITGADAMIGELTSNHRLEMSWKNYESDIIDKYHAILER